MEEIKIVLFTAAGVWATWRIGRAVKNSIRQWTENGVRKQHEERLAALTEDLHEKERGKVGVTSAELDPRLKSPETEPDVMSTTLKTVASHSQRMEGFLQQKLKQERAKIRLEREDHQEEIAALKSRLERTTALAQEKETALLRKVAEEEAKTAQANAKLAAYKEQLAHFNREHQTYLKEERNTHKNLEEKFDTMSCLMQEKETTFQQKLMEERAKMVQEREQHQEQIAALQSLLETSTTLAKENTIALLRKVAEEEAKTAQANEKFAKYKEELARFSREHQNYLKESARREAQKKLKHEESSSSED